MEDFPKTKSIRLEAIARRCAKQYNLETTNENWIWGLRITATWELFLLKSINSAHGATKNKELNENLASLSSLCVRFICLGSFVFLCRRHVNYSQKCLSKVK